MLSIARSELIQIFRNRLVLVTSLIIPVAVSAFFVYQHETFADLGSLGYIAAIVMFTVAAFGLYTTAVTTLASRRQNLFLKRLRSTAAGDAGILAGLLLPVTVIALVQVARDPDVLAVVAGGPANVPLLVVAVLATLAMMVGLALATAGLTNSPEHAQVTTLPVSLGVIAVASWVGITGTEDLTLLKRLLPGGAATELVVNAWNGGVRLPTPCSCWPPRWAGSSSLPSWPPASSAGSRADERTAPRLTTPTSENRREPQRRSTTWDSSPSGTRTARRSSSTTRTREPASPSSSSTATRSTATAGNARRASCSPPATASSPTTAAASASRRRSAPATTTTPSPPT